MKAKVIASSSSIVLFAILTLSALPLSALAVSNNYGDSINNDNPDVNISTNRTTFVPIDTQAPFNYPPIALHVVTRNAEDGPAIQALSELQIPFKFMTPFLSSSGSGSETVHQGQDRLITTGYFRFRDAPLNIVSAAFNGGPRTVRVPMRSARYRDTEGDDERAQGVECYFFRLIDAEKGEDGDDEDGDNGFSIFIDERLISGAGVDDDEEEKDSIDESTEAAGAGLTEGKVRMTIGPTFTEGQAVEEEQAWGIKCDALYLPTMSGEGQVQDRAETKPRDSDGGGSVGGNIRSTDINTDTDVSHDSLEADAALEALAELRVQGDVIVPPPADDGYDDDDDDDDDEDFPLFDENESYSESIDGDELQDEDGIDNFF